MKSLFKFILIIFSLAVTLLLDPSALQAQPVNITGSISNIKTETVVLVSNNMLNGEISSYQEENTQNYSGNSPLILTFNTNKSLYTKNKTQLNGCFIHNLSTDKQKVQQIRAP